LYEISEEGHLPVILVLVLTRVTIQQQQHLKY